MATEHSGRGLGLQPHLPFAGVRHTDHSAVAEGLSQGVQVRSSSADGRTCHQLLRDVESSRSRAAFRATAQGADQDSSVKGDLSQSKFVTLPTYEVRLRGREILAELGRPGAPQADEEGFWRKAYGRTTSLRLKDLFDDEEYILRVRAINGKGPGPWVEVNCVSLLGSGARLLTKLLAVQRCRSTPVKK
eukprot:scaffold1421_cov255-Pinguiococcus_pyrenoidosus.AAC.11